MAIIDQGKVIAEGPLKELLQRFGTKSVYVEADGFETLPPFPGARKTCRQGNGWVIETDDVMDPMQHILHTASEHGVEIEALEMVRPSLESVFLSLTGTSLRD